MCTLPFDSWMLFFTAAGTVGLALIAYVAYNKFLIQESIKTQMEIVIQLVKDLAAAEIQITLMRPGSRDNQPKPNRFNVFQIATILPLNLDEDNHELVYLKPEVHHLLAESFKHLSNPLLPRNISECLFNLKRLGTQTENNKQWDTIPYWIIGAYEIDHYLSTNKNIYTVIDNMRGLKVYCKILKDSIINWFDKHGVKDINHIALMKMI